jgi:capsular exopolysaccharide synthesis family protein
MTDRLEKALEKAREQRSGRAAGEGPVELPAERPAGRRSPPSGRIEARAAPLPVVYDTTRREQVTEATLRRNRVVAALKDDWQADAFRVLRARVLKMMGAEGLTTLGITSPASGEGKTLTAVNLAVSIAQDINQTVLLVDTDFRRPAVHAYFGLRPERGLSDYLIGACALEECFINPGVERLVILPQSDSLLNSSEVLGMPKTKDLFRELRARYPDRVVIYDLPPLLSSDDALVILPNIEASLLVVQDGRSQESEIARALDLLRDHNWLGTVLNRSERGEGHYY